MAEFDDLLGAALKRAAQPGDAAGVAEAIRARVAAGDPGTPAATSGFGPTGILRWWPWVVTVLALLLAGGVLTAVGLSLPTEQVAAPTGTAVAPVATPGPMPTPEPT